MLGIFVARTDFDVRVFANYNFYGLKKQTTGFTRSRFFYKFLLLVCFKGFKGFKGFSASRTCIKTGLATANYNFYGLNYNFYGLNYNLIFLSYNVFFAKILVMTFWEVLYG